MPTHPEEMFSLVATFPSLFPAITFASQLITEIISMIISAQLLRSLFTASLYCHTWNLKYFFRTPVDSVDSPPDISSSLEIAWILEEFPPLVPLDRQSITRQKTSKACTGGSIFSRSKSSSFHARTNQRAGFHRSYSLVTGKFLNDD